MAKKTTYVILCCFFLLNMGCMRKMVEFTPAEKERLESSGVDLSKIQYYNSDEIILNRVIESADVKSVRGVVIFRNGRYIDQVRIYGNTPGILVGKEGDDRLWVAFEKGFLRHLPFEKPRYYGNYFRLSPDRMENGKSFVEYDGVEYQIMGKSRLLYRLIERGKVNSDYRSAKGMRVDASIFNLNARLGKNRGGKTSKNKKGESETKEDNKKNIKDKPSEADKKSRDKKGGGNGLRSKGKPKKKNNSKRKNRSKDKPKTDSHE